MWDSGWVRGGCRVDVPYEGEPLMPSQAYTWAVAVRDEQGVTCEWSSPAHFETAPGEATWDDVAWLAGPVRPARLPSLDMATPLQALERIWAPGGPVAGVGQAPRGGRAWLRTDFDLAGGRTVLAAALVAAGAGQLTSWLNGLRVPIDGSDPEAVRTALRTGANVLALQAEADDGEFPAVVAHLEVLGEAGPAVTVATSGRWQAWSGSADPQVGWQRAEDLAHDDCADKSVGRWVRAEVFGIHGDPPRGREESTHRPSPLLRREFRLERPARRARLHATALGVYELSLSGRRVGGDHVAPGWTDYRKRVAFQTYDVTADLLVGDNVLSAVLADGWYAGNICWFGTGHYGEEPALLLRLEVEHDDGSRTVVRTDDRWRVAHGGTRFADLQNGELVDARLEPTGWTMPRFDATGWQPARQVHPRPGHLEPQVAPAITVQHELPATSFALTASGSIVVDFGQNLVGWVRLSLRGDRGQRVLLRHAEALRPDGTLYTENLRSARCTDEYLLRGDSDGEVFEPRFTVHGFRYCEVVGYPGTLDARDIVARVAYAAMTRTGQFECSDERLNRLQQNIIWGQRGNFLSVPTDCPQRDERLGWTGDAQAFASTAAFGYDVRGFFRKWLRDLRDATVDGCVPHVVPDVLSAHTGRREGGAAGWGDAAVILPWELLQAYGDERLAAEMLPTVAAWLNFLTEHSDGLVRPAEGFGDWLAPTDTPKDLVSTAFFARAAELASRLAERLGRLDDRDLWADLHRRVRSAFRDRWVTGGARIVPGTQTAYVLALEFGLLEPDEELRAVSRLVQAVRERNWHLSTGFLGTPYLLDVLSAYGQHDVACRLLAQDTYPSWLYPVVRGGATTMWERWDSWSDSRGFADPGMTSFNHYAYGSVGAWMYRELGGIAAAEPGYRRLLVAPRPGAGVTWARASLDTVHGRVATSWMLDGDTFRLDVVVPAGVQAEVVLPGGPTTESGVGLDQATGVRVLSSGVAGTRVEVGSGDYRFVTG